MADKVGGVYIEIQARMGSLEKDLRTIQARMQQVDGTALKTGQSAQIAGNSFSSFAKKAAAAFYADREI